MLWHMDRVSALFDKGERVAPVHIDTGIAKFCNVRCVFCYGKYQDLKPVFINREALLNYVDDAAEIGVRSVGFIGDGEPTCNPAVYEALRRGKANGLDMAISTNGVLVDTEEKCIDILESCTWMRFCISAGTKEGYKKIHGVDKFDKVVENIKRIVRLKKERGYACDVGMQAVFVPTLMVEEMYEESKLAIDLGVDYLVIKQCSLPDAGESGMAQFNPEMYDDSRIIAALQGCEALSTEATIIVPKWTIMALKGRKPYNSCASIPLISEISGNGDWFPCGYMFGDKPHFADYKFGNIQEQRLRDIFYSERYWQICQQMRENFDVHTRCKGSCRQDRTNEFCCNYLNKPSGINFI